MLGVDLPNRESWHPLTPHEAVPLLLPGWKFFEARDGALIQLVEGHVPSAEVNSLWCKRVNEGMSLSGCEAQFRAQQKKLADRLPYLHTNSHQRDRGRVLNLQTRHAGHISA